MIRHGSLGEMLSASSSPSRYNHGMATEPAKPKRKRRWLRYSLRTFLVLLTVFGVWLGLLVFRVNKQKEAVQWVKDHGGKVYYDFEMDESLTAPPFHHRQPPGPEWLRRLIGIDYFANVVGVDLADSRVTDLTPLAKLTSLEELSLISTQVSDLTPIAKLTSLERLVLDGTQVGDLSPLAKLTSLDELWLISTLVHDLSPLAKLTSLEVLALNNSRVRDLAPLANLPRLETLFVTDTQVRDLTPLAKLTSLEELWLDHTQVRQDQFKMLQRALPNCYISWSASVGQQD